MGRTVSLDDTNYVGVVVIEYRSLVDDSLYTLNANTDYARTGRTEVCGPYTSMSPVKRGMKKDMVVREKEATLEFNKMNTQNHQRFNRIWPPNRTFYEVVVDKYVRVVEPNDWKRVEVV